MEKTNCVHEYLRPNKKFPTVWCPGCGNGIVLSCIVRAVDSLGIQKDDVAMVSGIGCAGRMPVYVDFNTMHTTHGRALAFATGLKLARPEMKVLVVMGDGDALAIGGNHFIHSARRNIDLTAIVINNNIYGMTGGQHSPTTPTGAFATTATQGVIEAPFDVAKLAEGAGASFVARSTVFHTAELARLIERAIQKKGFSVVEAMSDCPIAFGRLNKTSNPADMLEWFRDNTIPKSTTNGTDTAGKIVRGIMVDRDLPEFTEQYRQLIESAKRG